MKLAEASAKANPGRRQLEFQTSFSVIPLWGLSTPLGPKRACWVLGRHLERGVNIFARVVCGRG